MAKSSKNKAPQRVILNPEGLEVEMKNVAHRLREIRISQGLTMEQVMKDLNMGKPQLSKDENGFNRMNSARLIKYVRYYGVKFFI